VVLKQVFKMPVYQMMRSRIRRARTFGSYQIGTQGGNGTALKRKKIMRLWKWRGKFILALPKA